MATRKRSDAVTRALSRALCEHVPTETRIVVALSAGMDSSVLLRGLSEVAASFALELVVAHVHHGLRGAAADADAAAATRMAAELGWPCDVTRVDPHALIDTAGSSRERPTLQEAARRLRYDALAEIAGRREATAVALAHHRNDQAETILLRLLRGTGPDGLAGMAVWSPWPGRPTRGLKLFRPLLPLPRRDLFEFAQDHGVSWNEDASNGDSSYARNRLRREWLPGLERAFNPELTRALAELADAQRDENAWRERFVDREFKTRVLADDRPEGNVWRIDLKGWDDAALPSALSRRLLRRLLIEARGGREVSRKHLDRMLVFLRTARNGQRLELPAGLVLARDSQGFCLAKAPLPPAGGC